MNELCRQAIGKRVRYEGTNGDEFDIVNHGVPLQGEGLCLDLTNRHGLCIMIRHDDGSAVWLDPLKLEIL